MSDLPSGSDFYGDIEKTARKVVDRMGISPAFKTTLDAAYAGGDPKTLDPGETTAASETLRVLSVYSDCLPEPGEPVIKLPLSGGGHIVLGAIRALPAGKRHEGAYLLLPHSAPETAPTSTAWTTANQIRGIRIPVADPFTVASLIFEVSGSPTGGCLAAAGLYSSDRTTKLLDSGAKDCSTSAIKTGTSVVGMVPKGWYWLVFTCNDNTTQFRTIIDSNVALTNLINEGTVQRATFGNSTGAVLPTSLTTPTGASFATFPFIKLQS